MTPPAPDEEAPPVMTQGASVDDVPNQPKTPQRSVRVPDDVWQAAKAKAEAEGRTLSEIMRICLVAYSNGRTPKL